MALDGGIELLATSILGLDCGQDSVERRLHANHLALHDL